MVLSEEQKKQLVERLRLGREQKAAEKTAEKAAPKAAPKKAEKAAPKKAEKAEPPAAPKPAPVENPPVIPFEDPLPPPVINDKPPKKEPQKKAPEPCIFENVEPDHLKNTFFSDPPSPRPTRKDKRLNKQKYMAIKFYEKPDERLYKRVMKSVQPDSSDEEPAHEGLRILDYEKEKKTMITEAEKADIERRKMEAIVRLMG